MGGRLPEGIIRRRKHGFILPAGKWLRKELRGYARDILFRPGNYISGFFKKEAIEGLFKEACGLKSIENESLLWRLFIFELWYNTFIGRNG
jgi:asparagine synthetase B (glutamine-hydrolysing)